MVAESVIVMKNLLISQQNQEDNNNQQIVARLAKMLDTIANGAARASIIWVSGNQY